MVSTRRSVRPSMGPSSGCAARIQNWKPSPRISHATVEHLVASIPYKADTAADIVAALPYMRSEYKVFPHVGDFMWDVWRNDFVYPVVRGEDTAEALAPDVRILLEDILAQNQ